MAITQDFLDALDSNVYDFYYVVEIVLSSGSVYYCDKSTTEITDALALLYKKPNFSGTSIDTRQASSSYISCSFSLLNKDNAITSSMSSESYHKKIVNVYMNFVGLDFETDAVKIFTGKIESFTNEKHILSFSARELRAVFDKPIFDGKSNLNGSITASSSVAILDSIGTFNGSGYIKIDDEYIQFTGVNSGSVSLTGLVRAQFGSVAAVHDDDAEVTEVFYKATTNPITLALQLLLSINGDGSNHATYDVLKQGLGLNPSDLDIDSFETIRDAASFGNYTLLLDEIESVIRVIETELLLPTFTRLINVFEGLLSLTEIDQAVLSSTTESITPSSIVGSPKLQSDSKNIVNEIFVKYDLDPVTNNFKKVYYQQDEDSINLYGRDQRSIGNFQFRGMLTSTQAQNFANSFLARNSTPKTTISFKTHLKNRLLNPGDDVYFSCSNLANPNDGSSNFNNIVEIMSVSQNDDLLDMIVEYTRFTLGRAFFISPAGEIVSKSSETEFTLGDDRADLFSIGMNVALRDVNFGNKISLYANFQNSINANSSNGNKNALINGSVSISGGLLDLSGGANNSISFYAYSNFQNKSHGCIRIKIKPGYSGSPSTEQHFFNAGNINNFKNLIKVFHDTSGNLKAEIYSDNETQLVNISGAWNPTSGTTYEIEFNFDISGGWQSQSGSSKLFVGGTQKGSTSTGKQSRFSKTMREREVQYINVGTDNLQEKTSNFYVEELIIFHDVQHTADYTPSNYPYPDILDVRTITNISGDVVTINSPFLITIDVSSHFLIFPDYDDLEAEQMRWASICQDEGTFDDGSLCYTISL